MPEETDDSLPHQPSEEDVTELLTPPTGGGSILPASAGPLREVIGDFEVQAKLGSGGMGAVYRARQISLGRMVALKILPAHMIEDADAVSRFQREARVAASLSHAHLVRVYSAGEADGCHYIAMELIEGEDLGRRLKRDGRMAAPEALRICTDVARGLEHAWQTAHLIHRDIKPANIFLSVQGEVKVGDLGLAKSILGNTTGLTQTGTMMGTPHYISPEQARADKEIDFRADIYSLGCTLYQMLTGAVPYGGTDAITIIRQHLDAPLPAILKAWPQCPVPLARLVGRMLKKSRHERPASYGELLTQIESVWAQIDPVSYNPKAFAPPPPPDLDATLLETPATPRATATLPPSAPPPKSKTPLYAALAAGVVILGLAAFLVWPKPEKLTKAQLYAQQRAAEQSAATPPPGGTRSGASETAVGVPTGDQGRAGARPSETAPAAIKLYDTPEKVARLGGPGVVWEKDALRLDKRGAGAGLSKPGLRDLVLRASILMNPDARDTSLQVRHSIEADRRNTAYVLSVFANSGNVSLVAATADTGLRLKTWKLPRSYGPEEWLRLELRAVGDELTVSADGQILGSVRDTAIPGPGALQLFANASGYFRDIEYVPLDGVTAPASAPTAAEPWQDVLYNPAKLALSGAVVRQPDGLLFTGSGEATCKGASGPKRDGALRMRAVFGGLRPQLRVRINSNGTYQLNTFSDGTKIQFQSWDNLGGKVRSFREFPLRQPLQAGQDYDLELRVVGQTFTIKYNGEVLGTVTDGTNGEGAFSLATFEPTGTPLLVKSLEVLDLDAPASALPANEPWQDLVRGTAKLDFSRGAVRIPEGLRFPGDGAAVRLGQPTSDGAIRVRTAFASTTRMNLLARESVTGVYALFLSNAQSATLRHTDYATKLARDLGVFPLREPLSPGQEYALELRAVGPTLTARLNGEVLGAVTGQPLSKGVFGVMVGTEGSPVLASSLEFLDLDAPGGTSAAPAASPATATKDAPFVNGLGMKFVPVPITGGPTGGQRVLFSIWETRVQDYEAFVKDTARPWSRGPAMHGPTDPAVTVRWDDAQAFCGWLTDRERKAGKITAQERYRLPSDHEWSCAVGIGDREDAARGPRSKSYGIPDLFPWGTAWPPPSVVGNYRGEETASSPFGKGLPLLPGYRDDFPEAAPVGSYPANQLGIFDLGGNAKEWCEDRSDESPDKRIVRGGSFAEGPKPSVLSAYRAQEAPDNKGSSNGFRVVLAPVP